MPKHPSERKWVMFQNVKQKDTHPDFRGEINIDGVIWELVGWLKTGSDDEQFLSGSYNPKKVGNIQKKEVDGNKI